MKTSRSLTAEQQRTLITRASNCLNTGVVNCDGARLPDGSCLLVSRGAGCRIEPG
jgi:hypothetical protein